jgi:hypothetical protein
MATIAEVNARVDCVEPKVGALNSAVFGVKDHPETGLMDRTTVVEHRSAKHENQLGAMDAKLNFVIALLVPIFVAIAGALLKYFSVVH